MGLRLHPIVTHPAIQAQIADMMLMAELYRLIDELGLPGGIGRARPDQRQPH